MLKRGMCGLLLVALAGCGSVAERGDAAAGVALRLFRAVAGQDGPAACATLAPKAREEIETSAGQPCDQAILEEDLPSPGPVTGTDVYGQWAQVRLSSDTVFLAAFPDGWRVVAAGCTPRGDEPYDCVIQGG